VTDGIVGKVAEKLKHTIDHIATGGKKRQKDLQSRI